MRNANDPGRPDHAVHAGYGPVATCPGRLRPRCPRSRGRETVRRGARYMTHLLPYPLASAGLLILWLVLNQSLSLGHVLLGTVAALVGGWALRALDAPKTRLLQ